MNEDIQRLHGTFAELEQVTVTEDERGVPAYIKVDRDMVGVAVSARLLAPRTAPAEPPAAPRCPTTPAAPAQVRRAGQTDSQDETLPSPTRAMHHQEGITL
ncbi:hypothetical protein [Microbacterium sp. GXF6406]